MAGSDVKWIRLGDYLQELDNRNADLKYGIDDARGVTNTKQIQRSKANLEGRNFAKFHVVSKDEFVYNRRVHTNDEGRLGLGLNLSDNNYIFTDDYVHFRVKDKNVLEPLYLYIYFLRNEFDRQVRYNSWGSATDFFNWDDMQEVIIPLPSVEKQREIVAEWKGLREMKEQNEQVAQPLMELCQSYLQDIKSKYDFIVLGDYIDSCDERNKEYQFGVNDLKGVNSEGRIIDTIANTQNLDLKNNKIVRHNSFAYSNRINIGSIALNYGNDCITSPSYSVFRIKPEKNKELLEDFLFLWFRRSEFLRSTLFFAYGTIKDDFSLREMCRVKIPLPPIDVQQAIVNIYKSAQEAKRIAEEADKLSNEICPALIQHIIHS